ncbi:MAG: NAD(P)/FAD-dependent oxidoreductase [Acidobacteriota bacterium]|nr:MAG: NAD(P)/FAD-dependent oxidoreductase [Acidobacteriota bacterium]
MADRRTEILVIGGGPAGLAAAEAASSHGKQVTVIDENPAFGGQIWRAEKSALSGKAKQLVDVLEKNGVEMIPSCTCVASLPDKRILAVSNGKSFPIAYDKVIIATGARERFIPVPGWTLPGVFGAGGLQALVKGGYDIGGKRIVVAGTGPLLLAVAAYLKKKGGNVLVIAEQASAKKLIKLGLASLRVPGKFAEAMKLRIATAGIRYSTGSVVTAAHGSNLLEAVAVKKNGRTSNIECDLLAVGYHLTGNTEVALLLDVFALEGTVIALEGQKAATAEDFLYEHEDIYCAGELAGIGGVEKSLLEGRRAGLAAAGVEGDARGFAAEEERLGRFASAMNRTFELDRDTLLEIMTDDTIVCRCEDVEFGKIKDCDNFIKAKLQTRIGMGSCQGRVCGSACEALFGWGTNSIRPPIVPLRVSELANFKTEKD